MGRLVLLLLVVATVVAVWYAFGPPSRKEVEPADRRALGPDDDEDFLWQIEKERFKRRRAEQKELFDEKGQPSAAGGGGADGGASGARRGVTGDGSGDGSSESSSDGSADKAPDESTEDGIDGVS